MTTVHFNWRMYGREEYLDARKIGQTPPTLHQQTLRPLMFHKVAPTKELAVARLIEFEPHLHDIDAGEYVLRITQPEQFRGDFPFSVTSRREVKEGPAIPALSVEAPKSAESHAKGPWGYVRQPVKNRTEDVLALSKVLHVEAPRSAAARLSDADGHLIEVALDCGFEIFEPASSTPLSKAHTEAYLTTDDDLYVSTGRQVVSLIKRIEKGRDQPTLTPQDLVNEAMGLVDAMPEGPAKTWIKECHNDDLYVNVARQLYGTANPQIVTPNQELVSYIVEIANLRDQVTKLTDSQIEVTRLLVTANAKAATAQAEISRLTDRLNAAERDTDNYRATAGNWRERAKKAEAALNDAEQGLGVLKNQLAAAASKEPFAELETRAEKAEAALGKMTVDLTRANERITDFQAMQPHWAKGYSSDGVAAQVTCTALNQLWELLGVKNQTEAVTTLRTRQPRVNRLIELASEICDRYAFAGVNATARPGMDIVNDMRPLVRELSVEKAVKS